MKSLVNPEKRLKAYDLFCELKKAGIDKTTLVKKISKEFGIPEGAIYNWYSGKYLPWGRRGELLFKPELFYVLGALIGDGCTYNWKTTQHRIILVGDRMFTEKYAEILAKCIDIPVKAYIDRTKNIWFVNINSYKLYVLFDKLRKDVQKLLKLIEEQDKSSALLFIEGFFDAEGCVKIIKEPVRKTPKICLDFTNTNYQYLELIRFLLEKYLNIEARYSIQHPEIGNDGCMRKTAYHLRIYKKEYIKMFFDNISTTKLKKEKKIYVYNWLNRERLILERKNI